MSGEENSGHSYTEGMQWPSKRELPNYSEKMESENAALKAALAELIPIVDHVVNGLILNEHYTEHLAMKLISDRAKKLLNKQTQSESDKTE